MLCVSGFELYARWVPLFQAGDRSVRRKVFSVFSVLLKLPNKRRRPDLSKVRGQGLKTIVFSFLPPPPFSIHLNTVVIQSRVNLFVIVKRLQNACIAGYLASSNNQKNYSFTKLKICSKNKNTIDQQHTEQGQL